MATVDINEHRRIRNRELERKCAFLEGERDRLEILLCTLLKLSARTVGCTETLVLDALITLTGIDPYKAHIHTPLSPTTETHEIAA